MINVVQEIVDQLRTVYPSAQYDIYTERIEQGFSAPCFSIRQLRADVTPYPSGLHEIVQHMDVRFFPSDSRPQEQCRETAQTLTLLLRRTESLRGSNLSWEITDEVLHFFADYRQFVREIPEDIPMENLQTTVGTENEAGAPAFTGAQLLTFDRYRERRDLLGVLLDKDQRYTFSEVDALIDNFMKGKVN